VSGISPVSILPASDAAKKMENRIYVGSLNYTITELEIRAVFGAFGNIRAVDMPMDPLSGRSKGFCFVDFDSAAIAQTAMAMNGVEIAGRPVSSCDVLIQQSNYLFII
jgi:RNA-binding protein 39